MRKTEHQNLYRRFLYNLCQLSPKAPDRFRPDPRDQSDQLFHASGTALIEGGWYTGGIGGWRKPLPRRLRHAGKPRGVAHPDGE
jgi:hypothetical protein